MMPLSMKQKARLNRTRQSDWTADLDDMNAMIGLFPGNEYEGNSISREIETDLEVCMKIQTILERISNH